MTGPLTQVIVQRRYGGFQALDRAAPYSHSVVPIQQHIDIKEQNLIQLNIDLEQRGLGGDDSWGAKPQEKYQIKGNKKQQYTFYLIPFTSGTKEKFVEIHQQLK